MAIWFLPRIQNTALPSNHDKKWRQCLDKEGISGALLTDHSKAFDCLLHDLLIVRLAIYGVG